MKRLKSMSRACAAALVLAALIGPASAEDRLPDFGLDAPNLKAVLQRSREAAKATPSPEAQSGKVESKVDAAPPDSLERRIVVFKKGTSSARRLAVVRDAGGTVTNDLWLISAVAVVSPKVRLQSLVSALQASPEVSRIERDFFQNWLVAQAATMPPGARALPAAGRAGAQACPPWWPPTWPCPTPDDPPPGGGNGQRQPWGIKRVNAAAAWSTTRGGGVKLAVIDTGIDLNHPELKVAGGHNSLDNAASHNDDHGHGSHVSGTIAAADNDKGVVGVAPDVTLYGVKVLDAQGSGTYASVIDGVQWCVKEKMDIANMSLGGSEGTEALAEAMKAAAEAGLVVVAAAGNSGGAVGYPAAYPHVIAVAASDSGDRTASFSSRGPEVDVIAPGVDVDSTFKGGGYKKLSGTSMASPHVAGLAALAVAAKGLRGLEAVSRALRDAATKFPGVPDEQQGAGFIDAAKLVAR